MAANEAIRLHWLNGNTTIPAGITWGVPWKEGGLTSVRTYREEAFESRIVRATVEQRGPVRAVVKLDGRHRAVSGSREWLPFSMRFRKSRGSTRTRPRSGHSIRSLRWSCYPIIYRRRRDDDGDKKYAYP